MARKRKKELSMRKVREILRLSLECHEVAAILATEYLRLKKRIPYLLDLIYDALQQVKVFNPHLHTPTGE